MQKIKRIAVALLAAVIISTNVYGNAMTVNAMAGTGAVVAGDALIDLLIAFLASIGISFGGDLVDQIEMRDAMTDFAVRNAPAFIAYAKSLADAGYMDKDAADSCGDNVEALLSLPCNSIILNPTLIDIFTSDDLTAKDGKMYSSTVDDLVAQDVFYSYSVLPSNVYVGYNTSIVPDAVIAADGYDSAAAHIQVDSVHGYYDIQESGTYVYSSYPSIRIDGYFDCLTYKFQYVPYLGSNAYQLVGGAVTFPSYQIYYPYGNLNYFMTNATVYSYQSDSLVIRSGNDTTAYKASDTDAIYWAPSGTMPICFKIGDNTYRLTTDGLYAGLAPNALRVKPDGMKTSTDRLNSVDSIIGGIGFGSFMALLLNSIRGIELDDSEAGVGSGAATGSKDVALSKEAITSLHDTLNEYYTSTVENYYQDTTYIDGDTYIENVTNIYQQAAVDNPAIPFPAVDDADVISSIKSIPAAIADTLEDVFVPDIALYESYIANIKAKFAFKDRFFEFGKNILTNLFSLEPEIPKLMMDFGKSESKYNYGGKTYALDMTWYARYKPQVDDIIVSIAWLCFAYWLIKNLPGIISGTSSLSKLGQASVDKDKD